VIGVGRRDQRAQAFFGLAICDGYGTVVVLGVDIERLAKILANDLARTVSQPLRKGEVFRRAAVRLPVAR